MTHLVDSDANQYSLQLNVYKYILEIYYGLNISSMKVLSFHPDLDNYHCLEVRDMRKEVLDIICKHKSQLL